MQNTISNIRLAFIGLSLILISSGTTAQTNSSIAPIISFILESNSSPVNAVPSETLQLDIAFDSFFIIPVDVNDNDGNLSSIEVTSSVGSLVGVDDTNVVLDDNNEINNFTISGSQTNLMASINTLIFSPLIGPGNYTITILSTDSEGESDQDVINVEVINSAI